ncbi:MAG TPA: DUF2950 domain-containing protein [Candidatus Eremiobacteraceae bacterium]|nr:DUF2950 domain-containing protein [Candidatus Eremiobacteraceae bacterium]
MRHVKLSSDDFRCGGFLRLAVAVVLLAGFCASRSDTQQPGQKTFASPEEASKALYTAAQNNDEKTLLELFGPDGKEIVSSGDETEDEHSRANFVKRYEEMNRLVKEPDGTVTLYIGARNWPYPIPIVNNGSVWYFDTETGKKEILYRRVGWNEASAIRVCQELVSAEKEYFSQQNQYAGKIYSDEGKHNGLYWKTAEGEPQSPIGPLVAAAVAHEYAEGSAGSVVPYRGYYFHILTRQGKNAPGGAKDYIANGKMTEGFAFVAYPAGYRSSGVMTFVVGSDGVIYQKDLGKRTEALAKAMTEYNPDSSWQRAEENQQKETAGKQDNK